MPGLVCNLFREAVQEDPEILHGNISLLTSG
jgi:hypothetical protein